MESDKIENTLVESVKLFVLNIISAVVTLGINNVLGGILTSLSIMYLLWRWRRDWREDRRKRIENVKSPE